MAEALSDGMPAGGFAMVPIYGPDAPLLTAIRERRLQPRDGTTVMALLQHLDWRSGRCYATPAELAEAARFDPDQMRHSLRRLRLEGLVARGVDQRTRRPFWCFSPALAATGGKHRRLQQWIQFNEALE